MGSWYFFIPTTFTQGDFHFIIFFKQFFSTFFFNYFTLFFLYWFFTHEIYPHPRSTTSTHDSLLLRRFVFFIVEASAKCKWLVMNRKGPLAPDGKGTDGRRWWKRCLARCLLPAFLCAHIFIDWETSGYEAVPTIITELHSLTTR